MPAYRAEWAAFVMAVTEAGPPPVTLADGVAALARAEAATLSLRSGGPARLQDLTGRPAPGCGPWRVTDCQGPGLKSPDDGVGVAGLNIDKAVWRQL